MVSADKLTADVISRFPHLGHVRFAVYHTIIVAGMRLLFVGDVSLLSVVGVVQLSSTVSVIADSLRNNLILVSNLL